MSSDIKQITKELAKDFSKVTIEDHDIHYLTMGLINPTCDKCPKPMVPQEQIKSLEILANAILSEVKDSRVSIDNLPTKISSFLEQKSNESSPSDVIHHNMIDHNCPDCDKVRSNLIAHVESCPTCTKQFADAGLVKKNMIPQLHIKQPLCKTCTELVKEAGMKVPESKPRSKFSYLNPKNLGGSEL